MPTFSSSPTPSHPNVVFVSDVTVTKTLRNRSKVELPGRIERYANGYGRLFYKSQFDKPQEVTIGPCDFWVLAESYSDPDEHRRGMLYWLEYRIQFHAMDLPEILRLLSS